MAKESMKAREVKRAKMVAKYAEKRAALKKSSTLQTILLRLMKLLVNFRQFLIMHLQYVCTIVVNLRVAQKAIFVCLVCRVFSSARWHLVV